MFFENDKGNGIRILDGVNEMLPVGILSEALDERNAFIDDNANCAKI